MVLSRVADLIIWDRPKQILWPPGYYILRDRIPFYLTILYLYRERIPRHIRDSLGWTFIIFTALMTGVAVGLYYKYDDMTMLAGIDWSAPSPIEWGTLITVCSFMLTTRGVEPYVAFYMSLIAAMGGGWLYECPGWIIGGFWPMAFFKVNATKVFFIEFQLFCLPILLYIVKTSKRYEGHWLLKPVMLGVFLFYAASPWLKIWLPPFIGSHGYRWVVRVPVILLLFTYLYGVKGEKT